MHLSSFHENLDRAMCRKEVRTLSRSLTLRQGAVHSRSDRDFQAVGRQEGDRLRLSGRLEIMHESFALPYRTFDTLRSVRRPGVVDNKRLDDMLSVVAEMQAGREQQRSKSAPPPHRLDRSYVWYSRR